MFTDKRIASKEISDVEGRDSFLPHLRDDWTEASSSSDIYELFEKFNKLLFWGKLVGVKLEWSNKMTRCAGICYSRPRQKYYCIRLSRRLLSQRPHSDLVETLLHEMIHAYLSVTKSRDLDSHGTKFHEHMNRINKLVGTNISVYHTFHSEVRSLKQHWWRCDGSCRNRKPFFGWVKRATNRAPGPWDVWWRSHSYRCSGRFVKVKEPLDYTKKRVHGLFGYGGFSSGSRLSLNNFGFDFKYHEARFRQKAQAETVPPSSCTYMNKTMMTRNELNMCPICTKRMPSAFLSDHLKVCDDLQKIFDDDQSYLGDEGHEDKNKNDYVKTSCPLCDKVFFNGNVKDHLRECDKIEGIFDDSLGKKVNICPLCNVEVECDLSLHVSKCLGSDIFRSLDESEFGNAMKANEEAKSCLVCEKSLGGMTLQDHLDICQGLQAIFDDDITMLEDSSGHEDSIGDKRVQVCPTCGLKATSLENHFNTCKNIKLDKPNYGCAKTNTTPNELALEFCPICGLKIKPNVTTHIERECLNNLYLAEDLVPPSHSNANVEKTKELLSTDFTSNSNSQQSHNDVCYIPSRMDKGIINAASQNEYTNGTEPLMYCRGCKRFYSMSYCPVCGAKN